MPVAFIFAGLFSLALASFFAAGETALGCLTINRKSCPVPNKSRMRFSVSEADCQTLLLTAHAGRLLFTAVFFVVCVWSAIHLFAETPHAFWKGAAICWAAFVLVLAVVEVTSRHFARIQPERTLTEALPALHASAALLYPLRRFSQMLTTALSRVFAVNGGRPTDPRTGEPQAATLPDVEDAPLEEEQRQMIESVFSLTHLQAADVMTPRTSVVALPANASVRIAYETFLKAGLSRIPIFQDTLDNVVGILFARDLLAVCAAGKADVIPVRELIRPATFVPETKPVIELLQEMRRNSTHMVVVLDEYGGTSGLLTAEDILEHIVGELRDEFEATQPPHIRRTGPASFELDAQVRIERLNREFRLGLARSGEYETVAGYILYQLGRLPAQGETFQIDGLRLTILETNPRRIQRVRLEILAPAEPVAP